MNMELSCTERVLVKFKRYIEEAILESGNKGKESIIRSQKPIMLIHELIKRELVNNGVLQSNIYPPIDSSSPELKIAGFLKQKYQDICVVPSNIDKKACFIDFGPLAFENKKDEFGKEYTENTLIINVRSQMSSIAKNTDTLFERTFAEVINLRMRCPNIVLGEVYLIPVVEYDTDSANKNIIKFSDKITNLVQYISFFNALSGRELNGDLYKYERCALMIVDFRENTPKLFNNTKELKDAGLLQSDFEIEYANINFKNFVRDILEMYSRRFDIKNLCRIS